MWEKRRDALLKLLVIDQLSSYLNYSVEEKLGQGNREVALILGGHTSQLQPLMSRQINHLNCI